MYDIVIVGGGPAGLTAAIYARRANKSVLILEKNAFGGQITFSPKVENYPGYESLSGSELADKMVSHALGQGADVEVETVTAVRAEGNKKTVETEDGNAYEAKAVILANGAKHRHLGLPNEERFIGDGISFCAVCDGAFYKNRTVALIGGGNSALQEAILLSEGCKKVYVIQNLDFLTGEKRLQEILASRGNVEIVTGTVVSEIADTPEFSAIVTRRLSDGAETRLELDGMFVAIVVPPAKADRGVLIASLLAIAVSCAIAFVPLFDFITSGFAIIIAALIGAVVAAIVRPIDVADEGEKGGAE